MAAPTIAWPSGLPLTVRSNADQEIYRLPDRATFRCSVNSDRSCHVSLPSLPPSREPETHKQGGSLIHQVIAAITRTITILQRRFPIRAPIAIANGYEDESKGYAMTEQQDRLAREREEIVARVANFKATQKKFEREREEYFVTTLENARNGSDG